LYVTLVASVCLKVLGLKVHLMYQKAREKKEKAEQRANHRSIASDLRAVYNAARQRAREEQAVKERLRQLRTERDREDPEDEPLLTEADAAEVLDEDEDDLAEAELVVPTGFSICSEPPWEEALKFAGKPASAASKGLVGRRIFQKYDQLTVLNPPYLFTFPPSCPPTVSPFNSLILPPSYPSSS
jgi:hypothetical protein